MLAECGSLLADSSAWGAISIAQSVRVFFRARGGFNAAKRALAGGVPGLFIPIDFGFFNIRLARHARRLGWKVLYFMPPGSWRRDRAGEDLPAIADEIVTPFPWSAELLQKAGAKAHFFGHPIRQLLLEQPSGEENRTTIAVLPGSRQHEIEQNLPVIAGALKSSPTPIEFAVAPSVDLQALKRDWARHAPNQLNTEFTVDDVYGVLRRAKAAVVCSGTATLEAALCRCPMVVIYRFSKATLLEVRLLGIKKPKFVSLPNILLDREAVPELIQTQATPEAIRGWIESLVTPGEARGGQLKSFAELEGLLGPEDAITRTAELAARMGA